MQEIQINLRLLVIAVHTGGQSSIKYQTKKQFGLFFIIKSNCCQKMSWMDRDLWTKKFWIDELSPQYCENVKNNHVYSQVNMK